MAERVLTIEDLRVSFDTYAGEVQAVRGVSLHVDAGEVLAIVGESGCGKSVTAQTIMKLNPMPPARIAGGKILLGEHDIVAASEKEMQKIRGKEVSMIFQDPMTCMNPTAQVGKQVIESVRLHTKMGRREAAVQAVEHLTKVHIPNPKERAKQYPHEFSGGMRQRAMIAMALICSPKLLIADEPTTALDVTIQAQILELMKDIQHKTGMAIIFITHNLGVVAEICDRVSVMYAGHIVEQGDVNDIFYAPAHPYTKGLLRSMPRVDELVHERLIPIGGTPVDLLDPPPGCVFAPRCENCMHICLHKAPPTLTVGENGHISACWLHVKDMKGGAAE